MKFNKFLLAALITSLAGQVALASTYDDDIYYNPSKSRKETKVSTKKNSKADKRGTIVTGKDGNEYIVTNEGMAYPV
ncbi:MAG: hypothetical protein K2G64_01225, partial [Muribaculaceae bacterium]|nr:hypothetical protein [Muribaculaceae bacterium]